MQSQAPGASAIFGQFPCRECMCPPYIESPQSESCSEKVAGVHRFSAAMPMIFSEHPLGPLHTWILRCNILHVELTVLKHFSAFFRKCDSFQCCSKPASKHRSHAATRKFWSAMAVTATLHGFFREDYKLQPGTSEAFFDFSVFTGGCWGCLKYFCLPPCGQNCRTTFKSMRNQTSCNVRLEDARQKQKEEGLSDAEFFAKYGFILMKHKTKMTAEDWLKSSTLMNPSSNKGQIPEATETPVLKVYSNELVEIIKELIPQVESIHFPKHALRRGPNGPNPLYGLGVHQDFGLYPEDMTTTHVSKGNFEDWMSKLKDDSVGGYSVINFWRPILPMEGPVKNTPLALCDPNTVKIDMIVPSRIIGFVKGGQRSMNLTFSKEQKWYYYPEMTKDEVLVFRQFHFDKTVSAPYKQLRTVFHSAFHHPHASKQDEARCSSEYRVGVWLKMK